MRFFCTFFDQSYLMRGLALYASLKRHCREFHLDILCLDDASRRTLALLSLPECRITSLADLETADKSLLAAKVTRRTAEYYFTVTPCLIRYLLPGIPEGAFLIYLDSDLYFYSDPEPLCGELHGGSIGITPHRFPRELEHMKMHGVYNAGWVAFRKDSQGQECLAWWRECCLKWCHDRIEGDLYAGQGYLNDWPSRFMGTVVIQHLGANVAPWNVGQYAIAQDSSGVTVNGHQLIFYHFHALSRITGHLFDSGLSRYGVDVNEELRKRIYSPYLDQLCTIDRTLRSFETLDSQMLSGSVPCFDLVPRVSKPDAEVPIDEANSEAYLYRQLVLLEKDRHSKEACILSLKQTCEERLALSMQLKQACEERLALLLQLKRENSEARFSLLRLRELSRRMRRQSLVDSATRSILLRWRLWRRRSIYARNVQFLIGKLISRVTRSRRSKSSSSSGRSPAPKPGRASINRRAEAFEAKEDVTRELAARPVLTDSETRDQIGLIAKEVRKDCCDIHAISALCRPTVVGLSMVKNEADVIEPFVRHNLKFLDLLVVLENASDDNTGQILAALQKEGLPLLVIHDQVFAFAQGEKMSCLLDCVQSLIAPDYVAFLDADEFIKCDNVPLFRTLLGQIPPAGQGDLAWTTYVMTSHDGADSDPLKRLRFRRRTECPQFSKSILRPEGLVPGTLRVVTGNHHILGPEGALPSTNLQGIALAHFPVRSASQLTTKSIVGWMAFLKWNPDARESQQGYQWRENFDRCLERGGLTDAEAIEQSAFYAQQIESVDWTNDFVEDPMPFDYVRKYEGKPLVPVAAIARSWARAVCQGGCDIRALRENMFEQLLKSCDQQQLKFPGGINHNTRS